MKSNVCKINKGSEDLAAIFSESEKVAVYNGLTHKQALQLRLLCEEIDGMLPSVIDDFTGELWIEFEEGVCKVRVSLEPTKFTAAKKDELIALSKNKKNAAAVGVVGKIRSAIETFFLDEEAIRCCPFSSGVFTMATGFSEGVDYAFLWSLDQYRNKVKEQQSAQEWDELEKSVIASVADDVIVGVKGKRADITIVKKFA